jgi:hypothetical protein
MQFIATVLSEAKEESPYLLGVAHAGMLLPLCGISMTVAVNFFTASSRLGS